jgi:tetratricopeptide (TPR) repeat protein
VADYFRITQAKEPGARASLIEEFLKKYPESQYVVTLHQMATAAYQQVNNYEKMVEHGEKTLQTLPASASMLSVLALAYASHGEADKATDRASRAITLLEKLTLPANADPTRFAAERNQYLASNYACLGSASLTKFEAARKARQETTATDPVVGPPTPATAEGKQADGASTASPPAQLPNEVLHLAKSEGYLSRALELSPGYEFAQFQIGIVYAYQNRADKAMEAFARTIALQGSFSEMARQNLEAIYKTTHKNSLDGLEDFMARFKPPVPIAPAETQK